MKVDFPDMRMMHVALRSFSLRETGREVGDKEKSEEGKGGRKRKTSLKCEELAQRCAAEHSPGIERAHAHRNFDVLRHGGAGGLSPQ